MSAALGLLLLAGCGGQDTAARNDASAAESRSAASQSAPAADAGIYQAGNRDRLCLAGDRAGFIVYADQGDSNCSISGTVQRSGNQLTLRPDGDSNCSIAAVEEGASLRLGPVTPACAYYCGPNASFSGKDFIAMQGPQPVTDLAGDPLC